MLGHDTNMNYMTRYNSEKVKELVAAARLELDPAKREAMYVEIQKTAKDDVHWIDLYYSPYLNVSRKNIENSTEPARPIFPGRYVKKLTGCPSQASRQNEDGALLDAVLFISAQLQRL